MRIHVFLLAVALTLAVRAQEFAPVALTVRQGETLHVTSSSAAKTARFKNRVIRLFPQANRQSLGLMPVAVETPPGDYHLELLGENGTVVQDCPVTVIDGGFPVQDVHLSPRVARLRPSPGEMQTVAAFRNRVSELRYWTEPLALPTSGCMISAFGVKRLYNGNDSGNFHGGIDQRAAARTPIRAAAAGVVRIARRYNIHGGTVAIDHGQGLATIYLHLSRFAVRNGAVVRRGQIVGYAGSTGRSTAPHLHWSIYVNGVAVNPAQWVTLEACPARTPPVGQ